jgi:hypothetical protein
MKLEWLPRQHPLEIAAAWAEGSTRKKWAPLLQNRTDLRQVATSSGLLAIGPELPWLPGLTYLGLQQGVYLPTLVQPNLPLDWLVARLRRHSPPPWLLLPPGRAIGLTER